MVEMNKVRENLERLAKLGNEAWKTPGHPMNSWVNRELVNWLAQEALDSLEEERTYLNREWHCSECEVWSKNLGAQ